MKSILIASAFFAFVPAAHALDLPRLIKPETLTAHREALAFTAEQETELTRIYESAKAEASPLEEAVRKEETALTELLRGQTPEKRAHQTHPRPVINYLQYRKDSNTVGTATMTPKKASVDNSREEGQRAMVQFLLIELRRRTHQSEGNSRATGIAGSTTSYIDGLSYKT